MILFEILTDLSLIFFWYCNLFDINDPLIAILFVLVNVLVLQLLFYLIPFLNRVAAVLTKPFKRSRFVIRVNTARELEDDREEELAYDQNYLSQPTDSKVDRIKLGVYSRLEMDSRLDGSNIYFTSTRLDDYIRVSMASWKPFAMFLVVYIVLFPFLLQAVAIGYFVHLYFSLVLSIIIPNGKDFETVFYAMVCNGWIPSFLMYWMIFGFFCLIVEFTLRTGGNLLFALIGALIWAELYYLIMMFLIHLSRKGKEQTRSNYPELGDIPDSDTSELKPPIHPSLPHSVHNE